MRAVASQDVSGVKCTGSSHAVPLSPSFFSATFFSSSPQPNVQPPSTPPATTAPSTACDTLRIPETTTGLP
ncbi:hypothetical protein AB0G60_09910 [Streptomyces angustmyceticus]|uniref:hypothetical protein n=1 Tax=Streptomyces angustmyceticus TaxID=285578 RepID=UPI001CBC43E0|nr:hypothetical protein [Streptomyces angustmyceticus]